MGLNIRRQRGDSKHGIMEVLEAGILHFKQESLRRTLGGAVSAKIHGDFWKFGG